MTEPSKQWIKVRYTVFFFKEQCTVNDYRTIIGRTLDFFASDPFKIMLSEGGFLWKL